MTNQPSDPANVPGGSDPAEFDPAAGISFFEKYLTVWVLLCMGIGILVAVFLPAVPEVLSRFEYAGVSIPIAVLIWLMIYPMMMKVDFSTVGSHIRQPKGLTVTLVTNWLIKPFTMYGIAWLFFTVIYRPFIDPDMANQYLAGAVLLGAAPCTAMVFVWSHLTKGDATYTVLQVAINDLVILVAFTPIVGLLLGVSNIAVPWATLFASVVLFVAVPLTAGYITRRIVVARRGTEHFEKHFVPRFAPITTGGLLLTLILIFSFQGETILAQPADILLIALPLIIQTALIFTIAYVWAWLWKAPHKVAAPAGMIGASNFFELAVAVAISVFGLNSGATLATVVGVLVEVPVMLALVKIANRTRGAFEKRSGRQEVETGSHA